MTRDEWLAREFPASSPMHADARAKFLAKIAVVEDERSCWEWAGSRAIAKHDYGRFSPSNGRWVGAHRWSWEIANGVAVPQGLGVLHGCDNPPCVRPSHLRPGTAKQNMQEASERGRMAALRGDANGNHRLTESQAREAIAAGWGPGNVRRLAEKFQVSEAAITSVISGRRWAHLPRPAVASRRRAA